jgi:hypothetical protein
VHKGSAALGRVLPHALVRDATACDMETPSQLGVSANQRPGRVFRWGL